MTQDFKAETPGQLLRAARLARGSDLTAAHEGTKIPLRLLEAIERDEYHQVSDALYVKSFLRNYAGWLGLDAGEVLRLYDQVAGGPGAQRAGSPVWSEDQVTVRRVGVSWPRYVVPVVAVVAVLALVWFLLPRAGDRPAPPPPPMPVPVVPADTLAPEPGAAAEGALLGPPTGAVRPAELPAAARGDSRLPFVGGERYDLVLRIMMPAAVNCAVRRDGQGAAAPLIWPETPVPLPAYNIRHGQAYAVRNGHVAYWGAADHFVVTLDDLAGVEVTLNGVLQPAQRWRPGQPVVLDRFALEATGGGR